MKPDAIRERLEAELADLERRHHKVDQSLRRIRTPLEGDWKEDASVLGNDEVLEALDSDGRARIVRLRAALERMSRGTYGQCTACGEEIAAARLDAIPEVATCIACAAGATSH